MAEILNKTAAVAEFILVGFTHIRWLQILLFWLLLLTYLLTIVGNLLIIYITLVDRRLQTPMYFFLRNFSFLEIGFTSSAIPKALFNLASATGSKSISLAGCFIQNFLYFVLGTTDFLLVIVMSVDRYIAICNPLHYLTIMNGRICSLLVLSCWAGGLSLFLVPSIVLFQMPFCGPNIINHFFCDSGPLIKLACVDTRLVELNYFLIAILSLLGTLAVNIVSYIKIISRILHIPSATGRKKTFSTCASHMTVVSIAYSSCIVMYMKPKGTGELDFNKIVALLNTVVAPFLVPFIYCLRNRQVQDALMAELRQWTGFCKKLR
ncbi:olfactory receptor 49-like [Python bivittatus]|uniref:Olfactory receptor n=1 Tax=Python bivittatus TaxID=176946 RepID=A0A9F2R8F3_PYTBI|nr:olfactory receptor 49-like [Python bivittatus]